MLLKDLLYVIVLGQRIIISYDYDKQVYSGTSYNFSKGSKMKTFENCLVARVEQVVDNSLIDHDGYPLNIVIVDNKENN